MELVKNDKDLERFSYSMSYNLEYLDLSFLKKMNKSLSMKKNKIIEILKNLFNFKNRMRYLSYHINKSINQNNYSIEFHLMVEVFLKIIAIL